MIEINPEHLLEDIILRCQVMAAAVEAILQDAAE